MMGREHWVETTVDSLSDDVQYGFTESSTASPIGPKFLRITDIQDGNVDWKNVPFCAINSHDKKKYLLQPGDLLFVRTGSTVGKSFLIESIPTETVFASYLIRIRINRLLNTKFVYNYFQSLQYWEQITDKQAGIGQPNVNGTKLKNLTIPLPPLPEQKRIVAKLDAILPRVKSAKARLEKIPRILKKFRQSVLAAACSGRLTEEWREKNPATETAEDLLLSMSHERAQRYDDECRTAKKNGKRKPSNRFLINIPTIDYSYTKEIPETWTITNIDYLAFVTKLAGFEYTKYIKFKEVGEIPVVRAQNVQMGKFVESNIIFIDKETSDFLERSQLFGREVLMVFIGAGTGNVCLAPSNKRWHLAPNVAKIDVDCAFNKYLNFYLQSPIGLQNTLSFMKETAQPSLSMETIRQIVVHLPPLPEHHEIVRRVEKLFSLADSLESKYKKAISRVEKIEQSVLAKAFRGELAEPDPDDEPAEELLKRILDGKKKIESGKNKSKKSKLDIN
jgi:type I restriction enzyme S subunit